MIGVLGKIENFLSGKKTYFIAGIGGLVVVAQLLGVSIPEVGWTLLALLGLGSLRSAISKIETK